MPVSTSLDFLKDGLSLLLSIPPTFSVFYTGKILHHQATLEAQGVTKDTRVWLAIEASLEALTWTWLSRIGLCMLLWNSDDYDFIYEKMHKYATRLLV